MDANFLLALGTTLVAAAAYITSTAVLANVTRRDLKDFKDEVNGKFAAIDNKFAAMDAKFENRFTLVENRLDSLEKDVAVIRAICEERYKK